MPTTSEHNVSCTWKDLRFIDEHQKSEIGLLETLMNILNASYYFGDYQVIDDLLERVEHLMLSDCVGTSPRIIASLLPATYLNYCEGSSILESASAIVLLLTG